MAGSVRLSSVEDDDDLEDYIVDSNTGNKRKTNIFDWTKDEEDSFMGKGTHSAGQESHITDSLKRDFLKSSIQAANLTMPEEEPIGMPWGGNKFAVDAKSARSKKPVVTSAMKHDASKPSVLIKSANDIHEHLQPKPATDNLKTTSVKGNKTKHDVQLSARNDLGSSPVQSRTMKEMQDTSEDISEVVKDMSQVSMHEFSRISKELAKSKKMITDLQTQRWKTLAPKEMVKRILLGKSFSLDAYKSLKEKKELLFHALASCDGNAISAVVLFLRKTLKTSIFINLLVLNPIALDHFADYLLSRGELTVLSEIYRSTGKIVDCAMVEYECNVKQDDPNARLRGLERWLKDFAHVLDLVETCTVVKEQIELLKIQIPLEKRDKEREMEVGNTLMKRYPRKSSIISQPLLTTVYYCAFYHYDEKSHTCHPDNLRKDFKLSDKQYEWLVLPARAKLQRWADVNSILTGLDWKRKKTMKSAIGFDKVSILLHSSGAPREVKEEYLRLIPNTELQLKLAEKLQCHTVVVDALVTLKDRRKLEEYRAKIQHDERLRIKVADILRNSEIKWKQQGR